MLLGWGDVGQIAPALRCAANEPRPRSGGAAGGQVADGRAGRDLGGDLLEGVGPHLGADAEDDLADVGANHGIVGRDGVAAALGLEPGFIADDLGDAGELVTEDRIGRKVHGGAGDTSEIASAVPPSGSLLQVLARWRHRVFVICRAPHQNSGGKFCRVPTAPVGAA